MAEDAKGFVPAPPPALMYDFDTYEVGRGLSEDVLEAMDRAMCDVLRLAFKAYAEEGEWNLGEPDHRGCAQGREHWQGRLTVSWVVRSSGGHWGDEFPVKLEIGPAEIVAAARERVRWVVEDDDEEGIAALRRFAAELRGAAGAVEALLPGPEEEARIRERRERMRAAREARLAQEKP